VAALLALPVVGVLADQSGQQGYEGPRRWHFLSPIL